MRKRIFKNMDYGLILCVVILLTIGLIALYSATQSSNYVEFKKQIIWVGVSIPVMIAIIFIDYETIVKFSPILYIISVIALIAVLFTKPINGATSWFSIGSVSIQPAEFAKIILIITIAGYMSKIQSEYRSTKNKFFDILKILAISIVPLVIAVPP